MIDLDPGQLNLTLAQLDLNLIKLGPT